MSSLRALGPGRIVIALDYENLALIERNDASILVELDPNAGQRHGIGRGYFASLLASQFTTDIPSEHDRAALGSLLALLTHTIRENGHGGTILIPEPIPNSWINSGRLTARNVGLSYLLRAIRDNLNKEIGPWEAINSSAVGPFMLRRLDQVERPILDSVAGIAALAGVDGAIVLTPELELLDFGATIMQPKDVEPSYDIAGLSLPQLDYKRRVPTDIRKLTGTRRQSAALLVRNNYNSLALVVSHDGPVRLLCWGNDGTTQAALLIERLELMLE